MASEELKMIVDGLRQNPVIDGMSFGEMREGMEAMTAGLTLADDVDCHAIDAEGVPAEWTSVSGVSEESCIVYLHGGGYVVGSLNTHRGIVSSIARAAKARVLSVGYRRAPEHPYPAAVEDGVRAYRFARASGYGPGRIAIAGDSAGGGLTLATILALRKEGELPPAAAVCISPWVDLSLSGESMTTKAKEDPMVQRGMLENMATAYLKGSDPRDPGASPLFADLAGLPPLLIQVGTAEVLLDDSLRLAEKARGAGVEVSLEVWDDMIHVFQAYDIILPEARQAIERIGQFLQKSLVGRLRSSL